MHLINLIHGFHNLSWITEISELFHDILIYWDAPVLATTELATRVAFGKHTPGQFITMSVKLKNKKQNKTIEALVWYIFQAFWGHTLAFCEEQNELCFSRNTAVWKRAASRKLSLLYSTEKSNSITGLERHKDKKIMTEFSFLGERSL